MEFVIFAEDWLHLSNSSTLDCIRFAQSLHKIGCTSAKHSSKLDILLSVCTIFALTDHKVCDNINNIS